jgi:hypothetical protein
MIEKEKALKVTQSLIELGCSTLDTKYLESHDKVAIKFKEHVIELVGGDHKYIKYLDEQIPLSNSEYKQVYNCFTTELKKRRAKTSEKFNSLVYSIEQEKHRTNGNGIE